MLFARIGKITATRVNARVNARSQQVLRVNARSQPQGQMYCDSQYRITATRADVL